MALSEHEFRYSLCMRFGALKVLVLIIFLTFSQAAFSQSETLFSSAKILRIRIEGAWNELLKQRYLSPEIAKLARLPVSLTIVAGEQTVALSEAQIGLRGNTSLSPLECTFPKYSIYFSEQASSATLFAGREQLAVGSHCSNRGGHSALYGRAYDGKSPLREALLYRLLEILEIPSFKTRPLLVQYIDSALSQSSDGVIWHQAFLLESLKQFSDRMGYQILDEEQANQIDLGQAGITDLQQLSRVVLFNELIGNNDWKINFNEVSGVRQTWNTFLAKNQKTGQIEVIPNDFDLAVAVTLLNGRPSVPAEMLRKLPYTEVLKAKTYFRSKRFELINELNSIKSLDPAGYQFIKKKFESFFGQK